jgi:hypothetical protein
MDLSTGIFDLNACLKRLTANGFNFDGSTNLEYFNSKCWVLEMQPCQLNIPNPDTDDKDSLRVGNWFP